MKFLKLVYSQKIEVTLSFTFSDLTWPIPRLSHQPTNDAIRTDEMTFVPLNLRRYEEFLHLIIHPPGFEAEFKRGKCIKVELNLKHLQRIAVWVKDRSSSELSWESLKKFTIVIAITAQLTMSSPLTVCILRVRVKALFNRSRSRAVWFGWERNLLSLNCGAIRNLNIASGIETGCQSSFVIMPKVQIGLLSEWKSVWRDLQLCKFFRACQEQDKRIPLLYLSLAFFVLPFGSWTWRRMY